MTDYTVTSLPLAHALLDLEQVDERRFRSRYNQDNYFGIIFGGQPMGQALAAAQRTVPDWPAHSCSGYFVRHGALEQPVDYQVEVLRDGRRFAFRRVLATQEGEPIFDMLCSFQDSEEGLEHQFAEPMDVPDPDALIDVSEFVRANQDRLIPFLVKAHLREFPIQLRLINPEAAFFAKQTGQRSYWFRIPTAATIGDPRDHLSLLAFMSDYWFAGTAGSVHVVTGNTTERLSVASLNHGLWIHEPVRVDDWLLFRTESPWGGGGRGLARGLIYNRSGQLVATAVQEIAMRFVSDEDA